GTHHVEIHPQHQRKGLATQLYTFAERHQGRRIVQADSQSEAGMRFWAQKNRPFGKSNYGPKGGDKYIQSYKNPCSKSMVDLLTKGAARGLYGRFDPAKELGDEGGPRARKPMSKGAAPKPALVPQE